MWSHASTPSSHSLTRGGAISVDECHTAVAAMRSACGSPLVGMCPTTATLRPVSMSPATASGSAWPSTTKTATVRSGRDAQCLWVASGGDVPNHRYSAACLDITCDCIWRGVAICDNDRLCASDCGCMELFHPPHWGCVLRASKPSAASAPGDAPRRRLGLSRARPRVRMLAGDVVDLLCPLSWRVLLALTILRWPRAWAWS